MPPKTTPCKYGCKRPEDCPYPHADCNHCKRVRKLAGWEKPSTDSTLEVSWAAAHPVE